MRRIGESPPQAPQRGRTGRLLGRFHVTGAFWYKFHARGLAVAPGWTLRPLAALFTTFFFLTLIRIRRAIAANLEPVLGPCGWAERQRRIFRTMHSFAWCLTEFYEQLQGVRRIRVEVEGEETWHRLMAGDEGFVLLTAHVGHWDLGTMIPSSVSRRRVEVVREEEMDEEAQRFLADLLERRGPDVFTVHFAGPGRGDLGMRLLAALRRGHIVALQGDRPRTGSRTTEATLFGRPVALPAGPAALARAAGVPIVPVFVFRVGRLAARVVFRPPIDASSAGSGGEAARRVADAVAREVEGAIRREPHQWFCFRRLWPSEGAR